MEAQIIQDGQIDADTISKKQLLQLCFEILAESKKMGQMNDKQQSEFIQKYSTFSTEYPSVFNIIMSDKIFYVKPFQKYLEFKKKQPLVYTNADQCVTDLCYYPIQLYKHMNTHYDDREYREFKQNIYNQMLDYHNKQKEQLKEMTQEVLKQQSTIKQNLIEQILKLATKTQLQK